MRKKICQIGFLSCVIIGMAIMLKLIQKAVETINKKNKKIEKLLDDYNLLNHWIRRENSEKAIEKSFEKQNIHTVGIYGMGELGINICDELIDSEIDIKFVIDKELNSKSLYHSIPVLELDGTFPEVDAIIVTPYWALDKISSQIAEKASCKILSLEDIIYSM